MSNEGPSRSEAAAAPPSNNNLKAAQQRFLLRQLEEHRDLLAKADEAANRAVAIQGSVHPDNDRIHLR